MSAGSNAVFTIVFHIPPATPPGTGFTNVATVSSPTDPDDENNSSAAQTTTPPPPVGDVGIGENGPGSAAPQHRRHLHHHRHQRRPGRRAERLLDRHPPHPVIADDVGSVHWDRISGPTFNCGVPGPTTTCTLASLPAGATATFDFVGHIPARYRQRNGVHQHSDHNVQQ